MITPGDGIANASNDLNLSLEEPKFFDSSQAALERGGGKGTRRDDERQTVITGSGISVKFGEDCGITEGLSTRGGGGPSRGEMRKEQTRICFLGKRNMVERRTE